MICTLLPVNTTEQATMLSALLSERLGLSWTLNGSFLVGRCYTAPPQLRVLIANENSDERRCGFVHHWSLQKYDTNHATLTIQASPYPASWLKPIRRFFACEGNLENFTKSLNAPVTIRWNPTSLAKDQWIALDESPWTHFNRATRQASYHWHIPGNRHKYTHRQNGLNSGPW